MTINELRDYLAKYTGGGNGDAPVLICYIRDNPLTSGMEIKDAVFLEWKEGDCSLVLQIS